MPPVTRPRLIATLQQALQSDASVDAAWEGGSVALDNDDGLSDVDAVAVVADEAVDAVFAAVERALQALSPIVLRHDVAGTAGYTQRFYRLRDAGEFLVVDLVLLRRSDPLLFQEVELHGHPRPWFDRRGLLVERHLDAAADLAVARARVPGLATSFAMFQHIVTKERLRGHTVDALTFYQSMTFRPLVEALRLLHDPQRRVFGPRYLARDLPADTVRRLTALACVRDLDDLSAKHREACRWFDRCIARLQTAGPGSGLIDD